MPILYLLSESKINNIPSHESGPYVQQIANGKGQGATSFVIPHSKSSYCGLWDLKIPSMLYLVIECYLCNIYE